MIISQFISYSSLILIFLIRTYIQHEGFPGGSGSKESTCNAGDPGSGKSPGEENGYPLHYSCLENSMDREAWQATVHRVAKHQTQLREEKTGKIKFLKRRGASLVAQG